MDKYMGLAMWEDLIGEIEKIEADENLGLFVYGKLVCGEL